MISVKKKNLYVAALLAAIFCGCDASNNESFNSKQDAGNFQLLKIEQTKLPSTEKAIVFSSNSFKIGEHEFEIGLANKNLTTSPGSLNLLEQMNVSASRVLDLLKSLKYLSSVSYAQDKGNVLIIKLDQGEVSEQTFKIDFKDTSALDVSVVLLSRICEELVSYYNLDMENLNLEMVKKQRSNVTLVKKFNSMGHIFDPKNSTQEEVEIASTIRTEMSELYKQLNVEHKYLAGLAMQNISSHAVNSRFGQDFLYMTKEEIIGRIAKSEQNEKIINLNPALDKLIVSFDTLVQGSSSSKAPAPMKKG